MDSTIFRPATFIERSLSNLSQALLWGCVLVVIVMILFLFEWRAALISMVAIPLSLLTAALILYWRGSTINVMTLAGLGIAVGEVVDDAIIDVENIARRLRLNRAAGNPRSDFVVVLRASLEVRSAVVYASLIVILVFVPVFFLEGLAGSFFRPLGLAYVLAIGASLLVALTVTPAMCLMLLPRRPRGSGDVTSPLDPPLVRDLKRVYAAILPAFLVRPWLVLGILLLTFVGTGLAVPKLKEEFLPNFQETDFLMHWVEKPGTSLEAMSRITIAASRELRSVPGVRNFGSHIGRAAVADEVVGPNFTELWISVEPDARYQATVNRIQEIVDGYPGLYRDLLTYLKERIEEVLTGTSATLVVRLFGEDFSVLREQAAAVSAAVGEVDGVRDLKIEPQTFVPQIQGRLRPQALSDYGLTAGTVRRAAVMLLKRAKVGELYEAQKVFDVVVWGAARLRTDVHAIQEILIDTPGGGHMRLGDVADVFIGPSLNEIKRETVADPDDLAVCGAGVAAAGARGEQAGTRARVSAGSGDSGRVGDFDGAEPDVFAGAVLAVWARAHGEHVSLRIELWRYAVRTGAWGGDWRALLRAHKCRNILKCRTALIPFLLRFVCFWSLDGYTLSID